MKLEEYDVVRLRRPLAEHALPAGAIGTIVLVYDNPAGYEVEFADENGVTLAFMSVRQSDAEGLLEKI